MKRKRRAPFPDRSRRLSTHVSATPQHFRLHQTTGGYAHEMSEIPKRSYRRPGLVINVRPIREWYRLMQKLEGWM